MTRSVWAAVAGVVACVPAWAQPAGSDSLNETQQLGRRLFVQSCGVCHVNVQQKAALYGPALSKASLGAVALGAVAPIQGPLPGETP